ncbi:MAG TPA: hypothetical protein VIN34_00545 [Candidatus Limnocylindria bacterium]|jgi:predicted RNase H-like HicB family nuclease
METRPAGALTRGGYRVRLERPGADQPGCVAFIEEWPHFALVGSSVREVLEQLQRAMDGWATAQRAAGQPVPPPTGLDRSSAAHPPSGPAPTVKDPGGARAMLGYDGQDANVGIRLSADREEIAVHDLTGRRRPCEARLSSKCRADLAAALAREADAAQRAVYSDEPVRVAADGGGRVDVAALPRSVAVYVFQPGMWRSRSVRLSPSDARLLALDLEPGVPVGAGPGPVAAS